jgi:hypothetical protein
MKALRKGDRGPLVKKWQYFLAGQGFNQVVADGIFGNLTYEATIEFQLRQGLRPDGIAGTFTLSRAGLMGFEIVKNPADNDPSGIHWPPKPLFSALTQVGYSDIFGRFEWKIKPEPNPESAIEITCDWELRNLVYIEIPYLKELPPYFPSRIRVHRKAARQIQNVFRQWEDAGLLSQIITYDGGYYPRMIRGSDNRLSAHSYGIAFDINASWNTLGTIPPPAGSRGSVRKLVEIANANGFFWGGHFQQRFDGMHFELSRFV